MDNMQYKTFSSFYIFNTIGRYTFSKGKVLLFLRPNSKYENRIFKLRKNMCTINWSKSEYQRHGDTWKPAVNVQNTFFYLEKNNNRKNVLRASIDIWY